METNEERIEREAVAERMAEEYDASQYREQSTPQEECESMYDDMGKELYIIRNCELKAAKSFCYKDIDCIQCIEMAKQKYQEFLDELAAG